MASPVPNIKSFPLGNICPFAVELVFNTRISQNMMSDRISESRDINILSIKISILNMTFKKKFRSVLP